MYRHRFALVVSLATVLGAAALSQSTPARAQDLRPEADPTLRLDGWLEKAADDGQTARVMAGVGSLVLGTSAAAVGIWSFSQDPFTEGDLFGALFTAYSVIFFAQGIALLSITTPYETRIDEWRALRRQSPTLDPTQVARFAAMLEWEAALSRNQRIVGAIAGFSLAVGGAVMAVLTTGISDDNARLVGFTTGLSTGIAGALLGVLLLLIETPAETAWNGFRAGQAPVRPGDSQPVSLRASPWMGANAGGLSLAGTF